MLNSAAPGAARGVKLKPRVLNVSGANVELIRERRPQGDPLADVR